MNRELRGKVAGERPREVRFKNRRFAEHVGYDLLFDENLYLWVANDNGLPDPIPGWWVGLSKRDFEDDGKMYSVIGNKESDWRLELDVFFYLRGKLIIQLDCTLVSGNEVGSKSVKEVFSKVDKRSNGKLVDIEIKFRHIRGLGIKPLRDYQIPSTDTDVALIVKERKFYVVKKMLAEKSPYFEAMFYGSFAENNQSEISIKDISSKTMTSLLDILNGQICIPASKGVLFDWLDAADKFLLTSVTRKIENMICHYDLCGFGILNKYDKKYIAGKYNMHTLKVIMEVTE